MEQQQPTLDTPPCAGEKPTKNNKNENIKIENKFKSAKIVVGKKTLKVDFTNEIDNLSVVAKDINSLFPVEYKGKFSLEDIKKVGLFRDYESIDECLFEIFEGLETPTGVEEDNLNIIIKVPLKVRRFPEITFPLKQIKKKDSEKYEELVEIISNMNNQKDKEIKELKEKVNYLENLLQIKNKNVKESSSSFEGSTLEIFNIGKDEYFNYFPEKNQYKKDINFFGYTVILECDEKNVKEVIDNFNKYKDEIKKILKIDQDQESELNIRNKKDKIYIDLIALNKDKKEENSDENKNEEVKNKDWVFDEFIKEDGYLLYFPFIANGLKAKLITKVNFVNLFEENDEEQIDKMIFNTKLDFEGEIIKSKIFMSFLILLFNSFKTGSSGKKFYYLFNDIFLSVINGDFSYTIKNQDMFDDYKEDKRELLNFLREIGYKSVTLFKDPKFKVFQKVNFNKIKVGIFGSPLFKVGYVGVKFESSKNNEFIDKILNDTINEETFKKFTE
jgi:hypothetical protein